MPKYLLNCACGRQLDVEPGQAGESLRCDCGATVAVPTLRQLRQLPVASGEPAAVAPAWGLQHGAMTVSLLLAAACLILAGVSRYSERPLPRIDPVARTQFVDREVAKMTPVVAWRSWVDTYQSLAATGFEEYKHPAADAMQQVLNWHRWIQKALVAAAAVCVVAAAVLGVTGRRKTTS